MWILLLLMGPGFLFYYWYKRRFSAADRPIELTSSSENSLSIMSTCNDLSSCKYDVFISFRGDDTRNNFIGHLYDALCRKKILVYKDDVTLPRGEEISPALFKGIEDSRISIVVFSENYATSRWCLEELVHILKCKREKGQVVLPVFYKVDPSHVRKQQESYAKAFVDHEKRFKDDTEKVISWRSALEEAANHSGWDSRDRSESELVEEIAQVTLLRLHSILSNIGGEQQSSLVEIEDRVNSIVSMLCFDSLDVRIIGIWGMGGIGKTTLAEVVQKRFTSKFESCIFVNVGNEVRRLGLHGFVKEFFGTLLKDKDVDMNNRMTVAILQRTKVFVVLDNVDELEQLECLIGASDAIKSRFGEGSRIILTSRDKKILLEVTDDIYKVDALYFDKALQLFYENAFRRDPSKIIDFIELSKKVVHYSGGNPLALKVLGSYLHSRSIQEWDSALSELRKAPNEKVQKVLRMSFDALDGLKKSICLDIGCFFRGEKREKAEEILGEGSHIGINVLVENCLITIGEYNQIMMHDLIQEMVWEIVRGESVELGQRSRLWNTHDSYSVFRNNKGSARNEGIFLDMSKMSKDLYLQPTVFEVMGRLRIIKIDDSSGVKNKLIHFDQGLQHLPDSLRYLHWHHCPLESLPTKFELENLVRLDMSKSKLKKLWEGNVRLENLKYISLEFSYYLIELPDLDQAPKLEHLNLGGCEMLHCMPNINGNLKYLDISGSGIKGFHPSLHDSLGDLVCMESLDLSYTNFKRIPSSINEMTKLKDLSLSGCKNIESLPELPFSLQHLDVSGCTNLESLSDLPFSLQYLDIKKCKSLKVISARGCKSLRTINADGCMSLREFIIDEHSWEKLFVGEIGLSFGGCVKLEESAKANILKIFQRIVFGLNSRPYYMNYPGNEIPKWIEHQQEGNSIVVPFPNHPYTHIKGFVVSFIFNFKEISLKLQIGLPLVIYWLTRVKTHQEWEVSYVESLEPHVKMVYINDCFTILEDDVLEATFDFYDYYLFDDTKISEVVEIKRCGIKVIYEEEAEEFLFKQMRAPLQCSCIILSFYLQLFVYFNLFLFLNALLVSINYFDSFYFVLFSDFTGRTTVYQLIEFSPLRWSPSSLPATCSIKSHPSSLLSEAPCWPPTPSGSSTSIPLPWK